MHYDILYKVVAELHVCSAILSELKWNKCCGFFLWKSSQYFQIFSNHRFLCRLLTWRSSAKSPGGFQTVGVVVAHTDSWCIELNEKQEGFVFAFIKRLHGLQFRVIKMFLHISWCVGCYACYESITLPLLIMFLRSHFNEVKLYLVMNLSFARWRSEDQQMGDWLCECPLSDTTGRSYSF